jgi:uncharacterized protein YcfJ
MVSGGPGPRLAIVGIRMRPRATSPGSTQRGVGRRIGGSMKSKLMRTVIVTSLLTALMGSALAVYGPKVVDRFSGRNAQLEPALYTGPEMNATDNSTQAAAQPAQPVLRPRPRQTRYSSAPRATDSYGEPVAVRHERPFNQSAMIVAGSAGTGAAIGAIAGGGKGAAIGALSGGVAGFIFDRMTAHK